MFRITYQKNIKHRFEYTVLHNFSRRIQRTYRLLFKIYKSTSKFDKTLIYRQIFNQILRLRDTQEDHRVSIFLNDCRKNDSW